ncbi:MAG: tRNA (adenosine(37)-N6)-dimethylallyltransferase MiaA [Desulfobacterales bacterium]|nr:tRNA (adenosine(37)-N6)-dimethylallyltransferase MiaA [Desulfobacterales bacterium]
MISTNMNIPIPKQSIIIICGPTGVGKTTIGIELAKRFNGEIISADSMQIYRYMDIGTAKPTTAEQDEVSHHMIDIIHPDEPFDAEMYSKMAREKIYRLHEQGIIPFVVGGTGFYMKALEYGLFDPGLSDPAIRDRLRKEAEISGTRFLYERLCTSDPDTAETVHPNDTYRIIRALEVYELTGTGISAYRSQHGFSDNPFRVLKLGLEMKRETLYERINQRVDMMMEAGFVEEVRGLLNKGYNADLKSMQSIGYRHMAGFIKGEISWEEAIQIMKRDTRRYAKRQFTWFNADDSVKWIGPERINDICEMGECFLQASE